MRDVCWVLTFDGGGVFGLTLEAEALLLTDKETECNQTKDSAIQYKLFCI